MADPLQEVQNKIVKLEDHVKKLQDASKEWRKKYYSAKDKLERIKPVDVNQSEIEQLYIQNSKLQVEISKIKRVDRVSEKKLKKIEEILKK